MWNILSKVFIVVIIVLLFPTGLILASQNASPGDNTYQIKRGMEGVLSSIFSLNPITKAYFKTDLSNRRFKESIVLLKRNSVDKAATNTSLVEMLSTTAQASADIKNVSDPALKKKMAADLSNQITNYRQNLSAVAKGKNQITPIISPTPTLIKSEPTSTVVPTVAPGQPTFTPTPTPIKIQISVTPIPTLTPIPACNDTVKNYLQCGGAKGFENYPRTHLLMIAEHKDSCTNAIKKVVTNDDTLTFECDPNIIGQCSVDDIQACIDMLIKIDQPVTTSNTKGGGNMPGANGIQNREVTPTLIPTSTPTPTLTPTPIPINNKTKSAYETLLERNGTASGSVSATPTVASGAGTVYGISTSLRELDLQNFINSIRSLISIFK